MYVRIFPVNHFNKLVSTLLGNRTPSKVEMRQNQDPLLAKFCLSFFGNINGMLDALQSKNEFPFILNSFFCFRLFRRFQYPNQKVHRGTCDKSLSGNK